MSLRRRPCRPSTPPSSRHKLRPKSPPRHLLPAKRRPLRLCRPPRPPTSPPKLQTSSQLRTSVLFSTAASPSWRRRARPSTWCRSSNTCTSTTSFSSLSPPTLYKTRCWRMLTSSSPSGTPRRGASWAAWASRHCHTTDPHRHMSYCRRCMRATTVCARSWGRFKRLSTTPSKRRVMTWAIATHTPWRMSPLQWAITWSPVTCAPASSNLCGNHSNRPTRRCPSSA
mmetsp:Transcript_6402/g.15441  ORF Transcript_6402/g.15441 Transcript_6402/m.15441 type:complete len:226 (-) Transcript_6402:467-1144(-)